MWYVVILIIGFVAGFFIARIRSKSADVSPPPADYIKEIEALKAKRDALLAEIEELIKRGGGN